MLCALHGYNACEQRVHLGEVYASVAAVVVLVKERLEDLGQARLVLLERMREWSG